MKEFTSCRACCYKYLSVDANYCSRCGMSLHGAVNITITIKEPNICTSCHRTCEQYDKFCEQCGQLTVNGKHEQW